MERSRSGRIARSHRPVTCVQHLAERSAGLRRERGIADRCNRTQMRAGFLQGSSDRFFLLIRRAEDSFVKRTTGSRRRHPRAGLGGVVQFPAADRPARARRQRPAANEPWGTEPVPGLGPGIASVIVRRRIHAPSGTPGRTAFECGDFVEHCSAPFPRLARQRRERRSGQLDATTCARAAAAVAVDLKMWRQRGAGHRPGAA
jgi:hypothetical protein